MNDPSSPPIIVLLNLGITEPVVDDALRRRGLVPCEHHRLLVRDIILTTPMLTHQFLTDVVNKVAAHIERTN